MTSNRNWFVFGEGSERHQWPNPLSEAMEEAAWQLRYGPRQNFLAAEMVDAYRYLVAECPTTAVAVERLRAIRNAAAAEHRKKASKP